MPTYDADGSEIPPPQAADLEFLCKLGGGFDETAVKLTVCSEQLDRERVSELLAAHPTQAWNPGEPHTVGRDKSGRTRVDDWGEWTLRSETDDRPADEKVVDLLNRCTTNLDHWRTLSEEYGTWLTIVGHLANFNRELDLEPEVLAMIASRRLTLKIDVFFEGDYDE